MLMTKERKCSVLSGFPETALQILLYYRAQKDLLRFHLPAWFHGGCADGDVAPLALEPLSFAALFPKFCSSYMYVNSPRHAGCGARVAAA